MEQLASSIKKVGFFGILDLIGSLNGVCTAESYGKQNLAARRGSGHLALAFLGTEELRSGIKQFSVSAVLHFVNCCKVDEKLRHKAHPTPSHNHTHCPER